MRNKILMVVVVKAKVGELENRLRKEFFRRMRKDLTTVVETEFCMRILLMLFQYGCEKDLTSNQLTVMKVYRIPVTK